MIWLKCEIIKVVLFKKVVYLKEFIFQYFKYFNNRFYTGRM